MNFLIINWPNFVYLLVDPGFKIPPPLNFYEASRFVLPIGWTPLTDTTDKETNERTNERTDEDTRLFVMSVRPSLRWSLTLKVFGFCEGSKFDHSHWIAMSPLTHGETAVRLWSIAKQCNMVNNIKCTRKIYHYTSNIHFSNKSVLKTRFFMQTRVHVVCQMLYVQTVHSHC